ncbi:FAD-binding oxidoreductase [Tenacibaculum sp. SG-28]|uniref:NAD(P)/FAD-dependent oxidoreductase n=1 Tax=Tenacibaculum sp. SG-28 TaxID=754426 RepID=UPI000CF4CEED|nr:FAD-dependent oxidoreductase [Tenacibaculum sp. SG-28]PQJ22787.1 amino acid dehydrogenase [Tenacibaculum sp. SG-28]
MAKEILIVGAGIIGLCSAYYLEKEGHKVTIIDKSNLSSGASYVNAGIITPSHIIPLAAPGVISKGIQWMLDSSSPFAIQPKLNTEFFRWLYLFKKAANAKKVATAIPILKDINLFSKELYEDLRTSKDFDFHFEKKGLLMYFKSERKGDQEWSIAQRAIQEGLQVTRLSSSEVKKIEPNAQLQVDGAIHYDCDAHSSPIEFMAKMKAYLQKKGVLFIEQTKAERFIKKGTKITGIETNEKCIQGDEIIVAGGAWTAQLIKTLGITIPIQPGKGYAIDTMQKTGITIPSILTEAKVAVTPMRGFTRFAGTMEIGGYNTKIKLTKINGMVNTSESYFKNLKLSHTEIKKAQSGFRPCSPDGLPYLGRLSEYNNVTVATGHAMMGWSLAPATGKLISELLMDKQTSLNLSPFNVERYR